MPYEYLPVQHVLFISYQFTSPSTTFPGLKLGWFASHHSTIGASGRSCHMDLVRRWQWDHNQRHQCYASPKHTSNSTSLRFSKSATFMHLVPLEYYVLSAQKNIYDSRIPRPFPRRKAESKTLDWGRVGGFLSEETLDSSSVKGCSVRYDENQAEHEGYEARANLIRVNISQQILSSSNLCQRNPGSPSSLLMSLLNLDTTKLSTINERINICECCIPRNHCNINTAFSIGIDNATLTRWSILRREVVELGSSVLSLL